MSSIPGLYNHDFGDIKKLADLVTEVRLDRPNSPTWDQHAGLLISVGLSTNQIWDMIICYVLFLCKMALDEPDDIEIKVELVEWMHKVSKWSGGEGYISCKIVEPFPVNIKRGGILGDPNPPKFGLSLSNDEITRIPILVYDGTWMDSAIQRGYMRHIFHWVMLM